MENKNDTEKKIKGHQMRLKKKKTKEKEEEEAENIKEAKNRRKTNIQIKVD